MKGGSWNYVSSAELHGFVDGELGREQEKRVLRFLSASPEDAALVEIWRRQNEALRAFLGGAAQPPSARQSFNPSRREESGSWGVREERSPGARPLRERWFAPLLGAAFASGALLAWGVVSLDSSGRSSQPSPLEDHPLLEAEKEVLFRQALEALGARAAPLQSQAPQSPNQTREDDSAPLLPNIAAGNLKFAGVRAAPGPRGRILCFFYAKPGAGNVALCGGRAASPGAASGQPDTLPPVSAIHWQQNGAEYVLAGSLGVEDLAQAAEEAQSQIGALSAP
jgi:anti-sigma factor RsiW